jgi:hypothetical protein
MQSFSPLPVQHALPAYPPCVGNSNYTWRSVQVMKLLIMQFSPTSYHLIPLSSKQSPQHPALTPSVYVEQV